MSTLDFVNKTSDRRYEPKIKVRKSKIEMVKHGKYHTAMTTKIEGRPEPGLNRKGRRYITFAKRRSSKPVHPINTIAGQKAKEARRQKELKKYLAGKKK